MGACPIEDQMISNDENIERVLFIVRMKFQPLNYNFAVYCQASKKTKKGNSMSNSG